jgi:ribosome-associated protein
MNTQTGSDTRYKARMIVSWLEDKQARDVVALDVRAINSITEAVLIASAANARHAQALADTLMEKFSEQDLEVLGMEGYRPGSWILIDCNDVVVHIFQENERGFYNLEGLWSKAPQLFEHPVD